MKVLLTGMTPNHIGANLGKSYWDTELVEAALRHGGHEVTRRAVTTGEDLSMFDCAVIGQQKLNSLSVFYYRYGALWAASQLPHVVFYEDLAKEIRAYRTGLKARYIWDYPTAKMVTPRLLGFREPARAYREILDAQVERWASPDTQAVMIAYRWGKNDQMRPFLPGTVTFIDLTAFYDGGWGQVLPSDIPPKREWIFATLVNQTKWDYDPRRGLEWPVDNRGYPEWTMGGQVLARGGYRGKKLSRSELLRLYQGAWGNLTWPYRGPVVGAGVWRDRFHDAIRSERVLLAQPGEVAGLGAPYLKTVMEIESSTDAELRILAAEQAHVFQSYQLSRGDAADAFTKVLTEVTSR